MKKVPLAFLIVTLCCALYPVQTFPQEQSTVCEIETEGAGVIISGDKARARDNAIRESLKRAIEKAVMTFLSPETVAENFQGINDGIYSKSRDYVQSYKIIEKRTDGDYYRVRIRAAVIEEGIRNDLESMGFPVARRNLPRVMVIIHGNGNEMRDLEVTLKPEELSSSIYVISRDLSKEGFIIVGYPRDEYGEEDWNEDDVASLGRNFNADLVIIGEVSVEERSDIEGTEMKSYEARVSAKAVKTDDATVVASTTAQAESYTTDSITGRSDAIEKATEEVADYLKLRIIADWQLEVSSIKVISVTIRDIMSYSDYVTVRDVLKNEIRGVKKVFQKRMEPGIAMLDVEMEGNARFLTNELSAGKFDAFSLGIVCTSENSLELSIIK
ncbi:MAG: hypothetical protein U9R24_03670 [Thermodesulfobacteriota bacterium]|nr:hypothetical protein [Thermodesulfobacteriota bacterium]